MLTKEQIEAHRLYLRRAFERFGRGGADPMNEALCDTALAAIARPEDAKLEEANAILTALSREYNKDDQCDYTKINQLIERGEVFLEEGPVTSKAYWACWGGEVEPTEEDHAEYRRYCERAIKRLQERVPQSQEGK